VRYIHGLSQELEFTLQQFDNVISARVHVVLPERFSPGDPIQPSSAAVFIKHRLPFDEDSVIPRVRSLVASSIPGLSGEGGLNKVSVTLVPSNNVLPDAVEWKSVGPFTVQAGSAGWLYGLFIAVAILFVSVLGFVAKVFFFANKDSKGAQFVKKYFGKGAAIDAKAIRDTVANSAEKVINSVKK
jgi:type III secretion protein J